MATLRILALLAGLIALIVETAQRRYDGQFPLKTLVRERAPLVTGTLIAAGLAAGIASVLAPLLVNVAQGWARIIPASIPEGTMAWVALAVISLVGKLILVFFEELVYRGSLLPLIRKRLGAVSAVILSAAAFALAHGGRDALDHAVLFVDGLGFGIAFVMTGSLWVPIVWHWAKNMTVWALGGGLLQSVDGPFRIELTGPTDIVGTAGGANLLDLAVTAAVVLAMVLYLRRRNR